MSRSNGDGEEQPVPVTWRPALTVIVDALVRRNGEFPGGQLDVEPPSEDVWEQCRMALQGYGDVDFVPLPLEAWDSAVRLPWGDHWRCYVDMWMVQEGRSDLVLAVRVHGTAAGPRFAIDSVYVP
ncbi:MAG: DUF7668 domain-containing protein [Angustibacter sp.]